MSTQASQHEQAPAKPSLGKGLLILFGVVVVVGAFIALTQALEIADAWVAFLFLCYWAGIDHAEFKKLPHCLVGAALGLTVAHLLHALPQAMGPSAGVVCLVGILALIYFQIMGWFLVAVNMVTMIFLTVGTIPIVQTNASYPGLMLALAVGVVYFAGIVWVGGRVMRKKAATEATTAA